MTPEASPQPSQDVNGGLIKRKATMERRRRAARQPRNRRIRLVNEGFTRLLLCFRGRSAETASITMASGFIA
jgi:hypothetical protein